MQLFAGLWHLGDPFYDGRYHYNWGPAFWLLRAQDTNDAGIAASYFGVAGYHSHPQLIGAVIAPWTQVVGYSESSIRSLALLLAVIATALLAWWVRRHAGNVAALAAAALFASLPIIYMFGKKLDQENLLIIFLLLQLIGYSYVKSSVRWGLVAIGASSFLMMSSDWSGAVFAAALWVGALAAWGWSANRQLLIRAACVSATGVVAGLIVFLVQSYVQEAHGSASKLFGDYYQVWQYRAGKDSGLPWYWWLYRQYYFLVENFSLPLFLLALGSLGVAARTRTRAVEHRELAIFGLAVFFGSLVYQLAVPQASGVHVYYQFYYAIPVAIGLYLAANFFAKRYAPRLKNGSLVVAGLLFLSSALWTVHIYYEFINVNQSGDRSDIGLLRSLREIPPDLEIVVGEATELGRAWFQGPNIRYYAGRDIPTYLLEEGIKLAPYQIIPAFTTKDYADAINIKHAYGRGVTAAVMYCSTHYCLLNILIPHR